MLCDVEIGNLVTSRLNFLIYDYFNSIKNDLKGYTNGLLFPTLPPTVTIPMIYAIR